MGAAIAELLPVPLVLLDPERHLSEAWNHPKTHENASCSSGLEAIFVFLIPFIIHNVPGALHSSWKL